MKHKIQIELTTEEWEMLQAEAIKYGAEPRQLVAGFVADLTASFRSHGSDERDMAEAYADRRWKPRRAELTPAEQDAMERHASRGWVARNLEVAEWKRRQFETLKAEM